MRSYFGVVGWVVMVASCENVFSCTHNRPRSYLPRELAHLPPHELARGRVGGIDARHCGVYNCWSALFGSAESQIYAFSWLNHTHRCLSYPLR